MDISQGGMSILKSIGLADNNGKLQDNLESRLKNLDDTQLKQIEAIIDDGILQKELTKDQVDSIEKLINKNTNLSDVGDRLDSTINLLMNELEDGITIKNMPGYEDYTPEGFEAGGSNWTSKSDTELEQTFNEAVKGKKMSEIWNNENFQFEKDGNKITENDFWKNTGETSESLTKLQLHNMLIADQTVDAGQGFILKTPTEEEYKIITTGNKNEEGQDLFMVNDDKLMTSNELEGLFGDKENTLTSVKDKLGDLITSVDNVDDGVKDFHKDYNDNNNDNAFSGYLANGQLMLSNEAFHNSSYLNHVTDSSMDWEQLRNDMEFMGGNFSNSAVDNQAASRAMAERTGNTTYLTTSIDNVSVNGNRGYGTSDRKALDIYVYASDSFDVQTKEAINKAREWAKPGEIVIMLDMFPLNGTLNEIIKRVDISTLI